jgi:hypothetical protein
MRINILKTTFSGDDMQGRSECPIVAAARVLTEIKVPQLRIPILQLQRSQQSL